MHPGTFLGNASGLFVSEGGSDSIIQLSLAGRRSHGVPVIYVSQPTENSPAGRMMRRMLANMASFYTEQQSLDVTEGLARRVEAGLFISRAVYGYANVRRDGRSIVEVDDEHGKKIPKESKNAMQVNKADLQRQLTNLKDQQDRLLNMRLADEIDEATFAAKNTEMRDRIARLQSEIQPAADEAPKTGDSALKAFELSQTLREK